MSYQRKTRDLFIIQADYGYGDGWEDEHAELTRREARESLRAYRENAPEGNYHIKIKREPLGQ